MRVKMKPKKDNKVFKQTAAKTKKVNIKPVTWRGGIHL